MKFLNEKANSHSLVSKIEIPARLTGKFDEVKNKFDAYPNFRLLKHGTMLEYRLVDDEIEDHFYLIEFWKEKIVLSIHAKVTPAIFMNEAVSRLLATLGQVSEMYELKISSIYPYLIMALGNQQINQLTNHQKRRDQEAADTILSSRLINLMRENLDLRERYTKLSGQLQRLILKSIILVNTGENTIESISKNLGLEIKEVENALSQISEMGYKQMYIDKHRFTIIKA